MLDAGTATLLRGRPPLSSRRSHFARACARAADTTSRRFFSAADALSWGRIRTPVLGTDLAPARRETGMTTG